MHPAQNGVSTHCPACGAGMAGKVFVCGRCWWEIPPKDRAALRTMRINRQPVASKLEKVVRELKAKQ